MKLVLLDSARGVYALSLLSTNLAGYLFYYTGFSFCPFSWQVGPSCFIFFTLFQLPFLVTIC